MDKLTGQIATFANALTYDHLGEEISHRATQRLIDALGCALGAHDCEPAEIGRRLAAGQTAGKFAGQAICELVESAELEEALKTLRSLRLGHGVHVRVEGEILRNREVFIQPETLGHIGQVGLRPLGILGNVDALDECRPARRPENAGEHSQRGCFSGAVRTDDAEEFTPTDIEREVVDRGQRSEVTT